MAREDEVTWVICDIQVVVMGKGDSVIVVGDGCGCRVGGGDVVAVRMASELNGWRFGSWRNG